MAPRLRTALVIAGVVAAASALVWLRRAPADVAVPPGEGPRGSSFQATRGEFVRTLRLNGLVEAVESHAVVAPRLSGASGGSPQLTIIRLAQKGRQVEAGDVLVAFDPQLSERQAQDKRAEWRELDERMRQRRAELDAARAADETELKAAENQVAAATIDLAKNEMLPRLEAEKNELVLEAARARFAQLQKTFALKRRAAEAELGMLAVARDRAASAARHAEANVGRLAIAAPFRGLVVYKPVWKGNGMGDPQEGEEIWPGSVVLDLVGPTAMRVRVKVNQVDIGSLRVGQPARVTLDAYPSRTYPARLEQVSPVGVTSQFSPRIRTFTALFSVEGRSSELAPDLSAAVDVEIARQAGDEVVP